MLLDCKQARYGTITRRCKTPRVHAGAILRATTPRPSTRTRSQQYKLTKRAVGWHSNPGIPRHSGHGTCRSENVRARTFFGLYRNKNAKYDSMRCVYPPDTSRSNSATVIFCRKKTSNASTCVPNSSFSCAASAGKCGHAAVHNV